MPPTPTGSDEYRRNLDVTFDLAVNSNHPAGRAARIRHPNTISTGGLFGEGLTEFSCHNDDVDVVTSILSDMRAHKQLASFVEIPMHQSTTFEGHGTRHTGLNSDSVITTEKPPALCRTGFSCALLVFWFSAWRHLLWQRCAQVC